MRDIDNSKEMKAIESLMKRIHQGVLDRSIKYSFRTDRKTLILFCNENKLEEYVEITYCFEEDSGELHTKFNFKSDGQMILESHQKCIKPEIYKLTNEIYKFCADEQEENKIKDFEAKFFKEK